jgi:hypothetical protein
MAGGGRNKRNLMRIVWELDENKRIWMGLWACWFHPIGAPHMLSILMCFLLGRSY